MVREYALSVVQQGFTKYSYSLLAGSPSPDEVAKRAGDPSLLEEWLSNFYLISDQRSKAVSGDEKTTRPYDRKAVQAWCQY